MAQITLTSELSSGLAPLSYQWKDSIGNVLGTSNSLIVTSADTYTLRVTDSTGSWAEDTHTVTEDFNKPTISITTNTGGTQLSSGTPTLTLIAGGTGDLFEWYDQNSTLLGTASTQVVSSGGQYTLISTDSSNGCSNTRSINITENFIPPTAIITNKANITCDNSTITLVGNTSIGNSLSYEWTNGVSTVVGTSSTLVVSVPDTYTLTVTDGLNGLTDTDSYTVLDDTTLPTVVISPSETSFTYPNQVITLTASGADTYNWSTAETTASIDITSGGNYTVTGETTTNGCTNTDSVNITENVTTPTLTINTNNGSELNCAVQIIELSTVLTNGFAGSTYAWTKLGNATVLATTPTLYVTTSGTYVVTVSNTTNPYVIQETIEITGSQTFNPPNAIITGSLEVPCTGTTTLSAVASTGEGTLYYEWSAIPSGIISGPNQASTVIINDAGQVTLRVYNDTQASCEDTATVTVSNQEAPRIGISSQTTNIPNITVSAIIYEGGVAPFTYNWTAIPDVIVGAHDGTSVTVSDSCTLTLTVTDVNGCSDTATRSITAITPDTEPPTAPVLTTVEQVIWDEPPGVHLEWLASTDNVGVSHYVVLYQINCTGTWYIGATTSLLNTTSSPVLLPHGGLFCFRVIAYDDEGNASNPSNTLTLEVDSCFVEGTKVLTNNGDWVAIEDLYEGDSLMSVEVEGLDDTNIMSKLMSWSSDEMNMSKTSSKISVIEPFETNNTIIINKGLLESTPTHTQLVKRDDIWMFTKMVGVQVGDELYDIDKELIKVTSVEMNTEPRVAYRLTLEAPNHMYYANEILTHNAKAFTP